MSPAQALRAIDVAQQRERRAMLAQARAAEERAACLEALAAALDTAAELHIDTIGAENFGKRARLSRREAKLARAQARMHAREAARSEADASVTRTRVDALTRGKLLEPRRAKKG